MKLMQRKDPKVPSSGQKEYEIVFFRSFRSVQNSLVNTLSLCLTIMYQLQMNTDVVFFF